MGHEALLKKSKPSVPAAKVGEWEKMKKLAIFIASIVFLSILTVIPLVASAQASPAAVKPCLLSADFSAGTLNKPFNSKLHKYILYLGETQDSVTVTPVKSGPGFNLTIDKEVLENKTIAIDKGKQKTICIEVSSQDKCQKSSVYIIKIVRAKSTVNDLKDLVPSAGKLEPAFDPTVTEYALNLDEFTYLASISAAKLCPLSKLYVDGRLASKKTYTLKQGETVTAKITAYSQAGKVKTYTIRISRAAASKPGPAALIEFAKKNMGRPYIRGAKGPDSFDCSGFVYYCLRSAGLQINYMTSGAWPASSFATITGLDQMQPGDVLCFKGHVGIYLGENMMIDSAPSGGGVRIASCASPYWLSVLKCGKRVF